MHPDLDLDPAMPRGGDVRRKRRRTAPTVPLLPATANADARRAVVQGGSAVVDAAADARRRKARGARMARARMVA